MYYVTKIPITFFPELISLRYITPSVISFSHYSVILVQGHVHVIKLAYLVLYIVDIFKLELCMTASALLVQNGLITILVRNADSY